MKLNKYEQIVLDVLNDTQDHYGKCIHSYAYDDLAKDIVERLVQNLTSSTDYYKDQLKQVKTDNKYPVHIKLTDSDSNSTKWLDLNRESAGELIMWLAKNYLT